MSPVVVARTLAAWCLLTALGIAIYWIMWWSTSHEESFLPVGYVEHERAFVFTDGPLAILLTATAILLLRRSRCAPGIALYTSGMLTFLGVIDLAYFAHTGLFLPERDGYVNAFIVTAVLALAAALVIWAIAGQSLGRSPRQQLAETAIRS